MEKGKKKVPAIEGWFTLDSNDPHLMGSRCKSCGDYFFPKAAASFCKNPNCSGNEFEEVLLSRKGKLWSFTLNCYQPPEPYVSETPFKPYAVAVVELDREKMMVLGQVAADCAYEKLKAGIEMEMILEKLYEDEDSVYITWKWTPAATDNCKN